MPVPGARFVSPFDNLPEEKKTALGRFLMTLRDDLGGLTNESEIHDSPDALGRAATLRGSCQRLLDLQEPRQKGTFGLMAEALHNRDAMERLGFRDGTAAVVQTAVGQLLSDPNPLLQVDNLTADVVARVWKWIETGVSIPARPGTGLVPVMPATTTPAEQKSRALVLRQEIATVIGPPPTEPEQLAIDLRALEYNPDTLGFPVARRGRLDDEKTAPPPVTSSFPAAPVRVAQPAATPHNTTGGSRNKPPARVPPAHVSVVTPPAATSGPRRGFNLRRALIPLAAAAGLGALGTAAYYLLPQHTGGTSGTANTAPQSALATTPVSDPPPPVATAPAAQSDEQKARGFWSLANVQFSSGPTQARIKQALELDTRQLLNLNTALYEQIVPLSLQTVQHGGGVLEGIPLGQNLMASVTLTPQTLTINTLRATGKRDPAGQLTYTQRAAFSMPLSPRAQAMLAKTDKERNMLMARTEANMVHALHPAAPFTQESANPFVASVFRTLASPGYTKDAVDSGMFADARAYAGFLALLRTKEKDIATTFATSPEGAKVEIKLPDRTEGHFSLTSDEIKMSHFDPETGRVIERTYGPDVRDRQKLKPVDPPATPATPPPAPPARTVPGQKTASAYRPS